MMPLFQGPMSITSEVVPTKYRGIAIGWGMVTWAFGNCLLPLVAWLIPTWKILQVVCVVPMCFAFFCWKITPESPRWLLTKKRVVEADIILRKIAKTNKAVPPKDLEQRLHVIANESSEVSYGILSLFVSWRLAMRTLYVTISFTASSFVYYQLFINIGNMAGNMFLNMFLLALVEGPGCFLAVFLGDRMGRRWTHSALLLTNAILFFVLMWLVYEPNLSGLVIFLCMWIKMNISATFMISYIQVRT
jgi:OCT family organic cation transporter-like MFS transporter 4/5